MKILVINGPNLNLLGLREPDIYGKKTYSDLCEFIKSSCDELEIECEVYQSNHEGDIVDKIQAAYGVFDGLIINPAAYTHTSVAILDAIKAVCIPTVEVHISDVDSRESFRQISYVSDVAKERFTGLGFEGYRKAAAFLKQYLS